MENDVEEARDSLTRCLKSPRFFDRFYSLLMESSDEVREKFATTDFVRQKSVLEDSLFLMMTSAGTTSGPAFRELAKLAERHSRTQLAIKPEWYDRWLDCLMKSVSEYDDPYSPEPDRAWRRSLQPGIELLKSGY